VHFARLVSTRETVSTVQKRLAQSNYFINSFIKVLNKLLEYKRYKVT
jgi:hypothetical protein